MVKRTSDDEEGVPDASGAKKVTCPNRTDQEGALEEHPQGRWDRQIHWYIWT